MELTLERKWRKDTYSIGKLYINGQLFCNTLEDKDRELYQGMGDTAVREKKVYCQTAIPYGRYRVTLDVQSPKYAAKKQYAKCKGYLPRLLDVPGFDGILIHIGNYASDSCGCILVGENTKKGAVLQSTKWFWKLYEILRIADIKGEEIWLTVQK